MSREKILAAVRRNKPASMPLPELPDFTASGEQVVDLFLQMVEAGGGQCLSLQRSAFTGWIGQRFPDAGLIASTLPEVQGQVDLEGIDNPLELENVDLAVLPGELGVAENGAVWISETAGVHRVLPFITQHLVLVLDPGKIVRDMHEAYRQIKTDATGFGVFIAGPSKTADIEQSLVIGAQGARSLTVLLIEDQPQ